MSFNEITRNLEDAGSREQRIRELAQSLQRRGLAMTMESARQLATSMVETERKVQKRYEEKKNSATAYGFNRQEPAAIARAEMKKAVAAPAPTLPDAKELYPELTPHMNVNEAAQEPVASKPAFEPELAEEELEEYPILSEETDHTVEPSDDELATGSVPEASVSDEEVSSEDFADEPEEAFVEDDDKPEDSIPEAKPRVDLGKKLGIDLSQMFNVNK